MTENRKLKWRFRHGERVCQNCGADFDPNWLSCQRCGNTSPVKKDDYNPPMRKK